MNNNILVVGTISHSKDEIKLQARLSLLNLMVLNAFFSCKWPLSGVSSLRCSHCIFLDPVRLRMSCRVRKTEFHMFLRKVLDPIAGKCEGHRFLTPPWNLGRP